MNSDRTAWFRLVDHLPVHVGWYEGCDREGDRVQMRYWDGRVFRTCPEGITRFTAYWRGLTREAANIIEDERIEKLLRTEDWVRWAQRHTMPLPKREPVDLPKQPKTLWQAAAEIKAMARPQSEVFIGIPDEPKPEPSPYEIMRDAFDHVSKLLLNSGETLRKQGMGWPKVHSRLEAEVQLEKFLSMGPSRLAQVNFVNAKANSVDEVSFFASTIKFHNMMKDNARVFTALVTDGSR
jgi:hypothetical protein